MQLHEVKKPNQFTPSAQKAARPKARVERPFLAESFWGFKAARRPPEQPLP